MMQSAMVQAKSAPQTLTVNQEHGVALASFDQAKALWPRMVELHTQRFGELRVWVAHEVDEGRVAALVKFPGVHHRSVVDTVDNHLVNTQILQLILMLKESRYLDGGSGRCECTRKPN